MRHHRHRLAFARKLKRMLFRVARVPIVVGNFIARRNVHVLVAVVVAARRHSQFLGQHFERALSRFASDLPIYIVGHTLKRQLGLVAHRRDLRHPLQRLVFCARIAQHSTLRRRRHISSRLVRGSAHVELGHRNLVASAGGHCHHVLHTHLIRGQRARLVRTDDRGTAKRLHRRQTSHNRVLFRHLHSAQRQTRGHHRRQTFRDSRDRQRHRNLEIVNGAGKPAAVLVKMADVDDPHQHTNRQNHFAQELGKLVQFLSERRLLLVVAHQALLNLSHRRGAASQHHHADGIAVHHQSAAKQDIVLLLVDNLARRCLSRHNLQ
mmetsp:Transcript_23788/g.38157  ORF Transcript_23788/g.38157 Transcript_23788/m.38157 type:complete len:321 (-) Transcript_23788:624-1586(-)